MSERFETALLTVTFVLIVGMAALLVVGSFKLADALDRGTGWSCVSPPGTHGN